MLGHYAEGRMKDFLQLTNLLEEDYSNNQKTQLETLLSDHETIIRQLRKNVEEFEKLNDQGNMDFATGLLEKHEKWAWFVRSYLK
jgi:starvation-inducible DNA-binding protein